MRWICKVVEGSVECVAGLVEDDAAGFYEWNRQNTKYTSHL